MLLAPVFCCMELRKLREKVAAVAPLIVPVVMFTVPPDCSVPFALNTRVVDGAAGAVAAGSLLSWVYTAHSLSLVFTK